MFANIPKFIEIVVLMYLPDRILKSKGMLLMLFALEKNHHERLLKKKYIIINRKVKILTHDPTKLIFCGLKLGTICSECHVDVKCFSPP